MVSGPSPTSMFLWGRKSASRTNETALANGARLLQLPRMNSISCPAVMGWVGCSLLLLLIAPVASRAELIASDDFEYDNATVSGCNGGVGWADAWTGENLIGRGSLQFADYDAKGNRLTTVGDTAAGKSDRVKCSFRTLDVNAHERLVSDGAFGK